VDGTGGSRPDTAANPQAYPQPGGQTPGRGFPVARLVGVLSWAWGAALAAAVGRIKGPQSSETLLCPSLHAHLERDDVVLAERFSCSDGAIALWLSRGIALVMRLPQRRLVAVRGGRRVGRQDQVVSWTQPTRPAGMDEAPSAAWPAPMAIRVLRGGVPPRGFRPRVLLVATTWLEAQGYPKAELAGL